MPASITDLLSINLEKGGKGFRSENQKLTLIDRLSVINAIPDPFERAAYLAMVIIREQPFKDANHRTAAGAAIGEVGILTRRTSAEMETWIRSLHVDGGTGMDILMLSERDERNPVATGRRTIIRYLEGDA
jgi:hypothetical protein